MRPLHSDDNLHTKIPQPVRNAITVISLCIGLSAIAALADRLSGRMSTEDFAIYIVVYGMSVMIPYKLARRSNATRFVFVVLIAVSILGWLGGLSQPLPPLSMIAAIIQIPILAVSIYWLFFTAGASEWFNGVRNNTADHSVTERIDPK